MSWRSAAAAAGLRTTGIVYADLPRVLPLLESLGGDQAKPDLAPLRTALLYGFRQGSALYLEGFVSVR